MTMRHFEVGTCERRVRDEPRKSAQIHDVKSGFEPRRALAGEIEFFLVFLTIIEREQVQIGALMIQQMRERDGIQTTRNHRDGLLAA